MLTPPSWSTYFMFPLQPTNSQDTRMLSHKSKRKTYVISVCVFCFWGFWIGTEEEVPDIWTVRIVCTRCYPSSFGQHQAVRSWWCLRIVPLFLHALRGHGSEDLWKQRRPKACRSSRVLQMGLIVFGLDLLMSFLEWQHAVPLTNLTSPAVHTGHIDFRHEEKRMKRRSTITKWCWMLQRRTVTKQRDAVSCVRLIMSEPWVSKTSKFRCQRNYVNFGIY